MLLLRLAAAERAVGSIPVAEGTSVKIEELTQPMEVDERSYKVFKSLVHVPSSEASEYLRHIKWDDVERAMVSAGFSTGKLHDSMWQFAPANSELGLERGVQFHRPHS